jgi:hypothetical protein
MLKNYERKGKRQEVQVDVSKGCDASLSNVDGMGWGEEDEMRRGFSVPGAERIKRHHKGL